MRLPFAALASTKLPSTEKCVPCTNPTSTHCRTIRSNSCSNSFDCGNRPWRLLENVEWCGFFLIETQARETSPSQMNPQPSTSLRFLAQMQRGHSPTYTNSKSQESFIK